MDVSQIRQIITDVRQNPVTQALYDAKENGVHPVARVIVDRDGTIRAVVVHLNSIGYYFHATNGREGRLEVHREDQIIEPRNGNPGLDRTVWTLPFDGWNVSQ
jgi:hypothetical protein